MRDKYVTCLGRPESECPILLVEGHLVVKTRTIGTFAPGVLERLRAHRGEPLTLVIEEWHE